MFSCGLREAQNGEVNFHDIQAEVLEAVINFVYTGKVQVRLYGLRDRLGSNLQSIFNDTFIN